MSDVDLAAEVERIPVSENFGFPEFSQESDEFEFLAPGAPLVVRRENVCLIDCAGLARFRIDFSTQQVRVVDVRPDMTAHALTHLLYDHIAPRILAGIGQFVLHGSAVDIGGVLAVFIGETGAGKSTLAASLAVAGHELLGDDAVVIEEVDGTYFGRAVYPSLRLYPESIDAIFEGDVATSPMAHYSDKRRLEVKSPQGADVKPVRLKAIFHLSRRSDLAEATLKALSPVQACIKCTEQGFALDPNDISEAARRLQKMARLTSRIPTYQLDYPRDFSALSDVHRLITNCLAAVPDEASLTQTLTSP